MAAHKSMGGRAEAYANALRDGTQVESAQFDDFVREQYFGLVHFLRNRTPSRQDAEDVAQESVVKLLHYRASTPVSDWRRLLYRIAINAAYDRFRIARHERAVALVETGWRETVAPPDSPDEVVAHRQKLECVRRAILRLPPKCRRVYLLKLVQGMTNAQIARHCGVSVKMVEKHLTKGLAALRREVGTSAPEPFK